jgi:hypothetical protein
MNDEAARAVRGGVIAQMEGRVVWSSTRCSLWICDLKTILVPGRFALMIGIRAVTTTSVRCNKT